MKIAAFIPIKSNSERIHKKNFHNYKGVPLYKHIIAKVLAARVFDVVYVDTDSDVIKSYAEESGCEVIDRLPELAENTANGNDLLYHHYTLYPEYDLYFQLFATAPNLSVETIVRCVNKLKHLSTKPIGDDEYCDSIFTCTEEYGWYWWNKYSPINYRPEHLPRSQDTQPIYKETTGLYGIRAYDLYTKRCRIGIHPYFYVVKGIEGHDIDWKEDLNI